MRFSLSRKEKEMFLVLDIGTEAIKSLIFKREKGKKIIIGTDLRNYYLAGLSDGKDLDKAAMKKIIPDIINRVQEKAGVKKGEMISFLSLSGYILIEKVLPSYFQREDQKKVINQEEEKKIYQKLTKEALTKISQEVSSKLGIMPKDLQLLNFKVLQQKIDGYEVNQLLGCSGSNLEIRFLFICLPKNYLEKVNRLAKNLKLDNLKLVSEAESLSSAFSQQKTSAIFLDVGGKSTQIFLMKEGKLKSVNIFDIGGENFSQRLSQALGMTRAQAEDLKIRYSMRTLSEEVRGSIRETLSFTCQLWLNEFKKILREDTDKKREILPPTIYLFGGGSQLPEIEEILSGENWEDLPFLDYPQIKTLSLKNFKNIEDRANIINITQYIPLLLFCYKNAKNFS